MVLVWMYVWVCVIMYIIICIDMCVCVCMYSVVYTCTCGCTRVCVCTCSGVHVYVLISPSSVCLVTCYNVSDSFLWSGPVIGDLNLCSLRTRYIADSKTDLWDDTEIHTALCCEDQKAIRFQTTSFQVSVCSCIIFLFLVVNIIYISYIIYMLTVSFLLII